MATAGSDRAGRYVPLRERIRTFIPKSLPPEPALENGNDYVTALTVAERNLGRLDGIARTLPNADLFVYMYVRKEAVLSSQIEGTQSTLVDLLEYEAGAEPHVPERDVAEVVNYVSALNLGLERLNQGARFNLDLICQLHQKLLEGARGGEYQPGRFRDEEVWIGFEHCAIEEADFVPPPPAELPRLLADLEAFINHPGPLPLLTRAGLLHAQFETIHPFFDGNGRIGRMLVTLLLTKEGALLQPLLYLSYHFRQRRDEYCARLQAIRDHGDWESWLTFFLDGVARVSSQAAETANRITLLRERNRMEIQGLMGGRAGKALTLLEGMFAKPIVSVEEVRAMTHTSFPTANALVSALESLGILREATGQKHYRRFAYKPYIDVLNETDAPALPETSPRDPPTTRMRAGSAGR
jgi:Fic family protein